MIEFITLLLGLSSGVHPVEVAVAGPVAAVVLTLDGQAVEQRTEPPWVFACDLGPDLLPHRLEALALDADGRELGRARQFINYHRPNEDAALLLESSPGKPQTRGRVVWSSFRDRRPKKVEVFFDDAEIPVAKSGTFTLPAHELDRPHHLLAVVKFPGEEPIRRDIVFGGLYGERVTSALTAVPVRVAGDQTLPQPAALAGWLEARGEPLRVFSTERTAAVLTIVRDREALSRLGRIDRELRKKKLELPKILGPGLETFFVRTHSVPEDPRIFQSVSGRMLTANFLEANTRGQQLPSTARQDGGGFHRPIMSSYASDGLRPDHSLWNLVRIHTKISKKKEPQRLTEALAVAGRLASSLERPRAVLLVVGREPEDQSQFALAPIRRFLSALRVPTFVWAPEPKDLEALGPGVGQGLYYGAEGLVEAFEGIDASFRAQHILWVEGDHLPNEIRLGAAAPEWLKLLE